MRIVPPATRFILLNTRHNENVGAAARAMKTMGFTDLSLVSPHDPKVLTRNKTIQRASGATDILKNAKLYATLEEALMVTNDGSTINNGEEIVCGTGMPNDMYQERTTHNKKYVEPRIFFENLMNNDTTEDDKNCGHQHQGIRIAFVFGNEKSGMCQSDVDQCQHMLGIPTNPRFGSLNVAAAVQLIAYDWRMTLGCDYDDLGNNENTRQNELKM
jgi:tRNA/rRNA methyltransferase